MMYVMLYDFLFGQGIRGGGAVKRLVQQEKNVLHAALVRLKIKRRVADNADLLPAHVRAGTNVRSSPLSPLSLSPLPRLSWAAVTLSPLPLMPQRGSKGLKEGAGNGWPLCPHGPLSFPVVSVDLGELIVSVGRDVYFALPSLWFLSQFPRYVRVNLLKSTVAAVTSALQAEHAVEADPHIPSLLVLPPGNRVGVEE